MSKALERVEGRKLAEQLLELADIDGRSDDFKVGLARHLRQYTDCVLGAPVTELRVMTDAEAREFEKLSIPFGVNQGKNYKDVPIDYLTWVSDQGNNLAAYLRSSVGRKRIEDNV